MSADNQLLIIQTDNGFELRDVFIESQDGPILAETKTLENAIRLANKYLAENIVEYGYRVILKDNDF